MELIPPLLLSLLFLPLLPSPSLANEGNILATGDTLPTDGQLSYKSSAFVIQDDCNLVLYNTATGFQSNTHGLGTNCTLTLSDHGQLLIHSNRGSSLVWSSPGGTTKGKYIAVLRPDGSVAVFGPSVWSTPSLASPTADAEDETPLVRNLMFSTQVVGEKERLESRDYSLGVTEECDLELRKAEQGVVWRSGTGGKGRNCSFTVDKRGRIVVVGDRKRIVWASKAEGAEGEYVLVVQIHGQAVVYGPVVWSTAS